MDDDGLHVSFIDGVDPVNTKSKTAQKGKSTGRLKSRI